MKKKDSFFLRVWSINTAFTWLVFTLLSDTLRSKIDRLAEQDISEIWMKMAKHSLYACAVVSSVLLVSVSAFDPSLHVPEIIFGASALVEHGFLREAKSLVGHEIDSLSQPQFPSFEASIQRFDFSNFI
ncbi:uncharacterized protein LOC144425877 [Styela clava]